MPDDDRDTPSHHARRWADAAWVRGWHDHAIDVLDHAIRSDPDNFRLFRKRGVFHLICPDRTTRDLQQGVTDLRRACELSAWRDDLVRWVAELLTRIGETLRANELLLELTQRSQEATDGEEA